MNIDSLRQVIADSIYHSQVNNESIYKTILTEQHETYELIVYIWIAITGIFITGTLFWNFYLANRKIESEVNKLSTSLYDELQKKIDILETTLESKKKEVNELFKSSKESFETTLQNQFKDESEKNKTTITDRFNKVEADLHRSFGSSSFDSGRYWTAFEQTVAAARIYQERQQGEMVSRCLNRLIECLEKEEIQKQFNESYLGPNLLNKEFIDLTIDKGIDLFSKFLEREKNIIKTRLIELRKTATNNA